jgi:two-component system sensor histidine kinase YesM
MQLKYIFTNKVNDLPLSIKFILIFVICLLMPLVCINAIFLDRFLEVVRNREERNYQISMERTKTDINALLENCIAVSHSISTDTALYDILDTQFTDTLDYYIVFDRELRNRLITYMAAYNYIINIRMYVDNPTIKSSGAYFHIDEAVKASAWYEETALSREKVFICSYFGDSTAFPIVTTQYFSIITNFRDYQKRSSTEKLLKVDMDIGRLNSILLRETDYLTLYLLDNHDNVICTTDNLYAPEIKQGFKKADTVFFDNNSYILETSLGDASYWKGWRLVGKARMERVTESAGENIRFVLTLALVSLIISSLLTFIIVRSYNSRLKKLSRHMLKFQDGRFDLIDINEGKDEIGGVIHNFNLMAEKINTLINDVYILELQKKDLDIERVRAELNFMQSQMNPHFLFNTLNALLVVCKKNNYSNITDIIKYLAKAMRRLLSWKDDLVEIEEEVSFTKMYLEIEKFRFQEKFEYSVSVNKDLTHYMIPRMSLQPLVENACIHGIQAIKEVGKVHIEISASDEQLVVMVEDNGKGMEPDRLEEVLSHIRGSEESNSSIGIRNVYRRLKLYYGDDVSFDIESRINSGTRVSFAIPLMRLRSE